MKNLKKAIALCLALILCLTVPVGVSAATVEDATIDTSRTGSITIFKYDLTNAEKDGVWDSSYVSTGVYDQTGVVDILGGKRAGDNDNQSDLGNGEKSYGYAIKGVEFSYLKIADIVQFTESEADARTDNHVEVLYGIDKVKGADFLKALGLEGGISDCPPKESSPEPRRRLSRALSQGQKRRIRNRNQPRIASHISE